MTTSPQQNVRHALLFQHTSGHIHDTYIPSLVYTIGLKGIWSCYFMINSILCINFSNVLEVYSHPPSVLSILIFFSLWFSTRNLNLLKTSKISYLCLIRYTQSLLLCSSPKETNYFFPPMVWSSKGPQKSECTTSRMLVNLIGK